MTNNNKLNLIFSNCTDLTVTSNTKFVLFSDCHRGMGTTNDNFLKNKTIFLGALHYYYNNNFTYIELGDGDELWENNDYYEIKQFHSDIFDIFNKLYAKNKLYLLYGNHDIEKSFPSFQHDFTIYEGVRLKITNTNKYIYLIHGHQVDPFNSNFLPITRFLSRYLWKPLEQIGIITPTSSAKNHKKRNKIETRLEQWAIKNNTTIISGHTHRPSLNNNTHYYNTGCCVHPYGITCIEIKNNSLYLVKWHLSSTKNYNVAVTKEILSGPIDI